MKNGRRYPANARSRSCHVMAALSASWLVRSDSTAISCSSGVRPLLRLQFDLVTSQVVPMNPAAAVRGPKYVVKTRKIPVLDAKEWRTLIDSIPPGTVRDLRDRALIATLTYSLAQTQN
jgi:site-specific recombinase XerC